MSASSRSAAAMVAASLAGSIAARKVLANASSICTPPTFRQYTPRPSTMILPAQW